MRAYLSIAAIAISSGCAAIAQAGTMTHCKDTELAYFSCQIDGSTKVVSLCGGNLEAGNGQRNAAMWLQYRFGKLNALELAYPASRKNSLSKFKGEFHAGQSASVQTIRFVVNQYTYDVGTAFSAVTGEGFNGVIIKRHGGNSMRLACAGNPVIAAGFGTLIQEELESSP